MQILAELLSEDLPEITWQVHSISQFLDLYTHWPRSTRSWTARPTPTRPCARGLPTWAPL
ncbi:hypothetical protein HFP72_05995 [Nocardiopsis sp. ARC36]